MTKFISRKQRQVDSDPRELLDTSLKDNSIENPTQKSLGVNYIRDCLVSGGIKRKEAVALHKQYNEIALTLPVSDKPMQRISEVLSNNGFTTIETCDGHGNKLPIIYLQTEEPEHLRHLCQIITREARSLHFSWQLRAWSSDPFLNPGEPIIHTLEPVSSAYQAIDPKLNYEKLKIDLNLIGLYVLNYFNQINEIEQEEVKELQDKIDRGLKPVEVKIGSLKDLYVVEYHRANLELIQPEVKYIRSGKENKYRTKGRIIEEYQDGFLVLTPEKIDLWAHCDYYSEPIKLKAGYLKAHLVTEQNLVYSFPMEEVR